MLAEIPDPIPPDSRRSSNRHEPKRFVFQWLAILATRWKQLPPPTNNTDEQHRRAASSSDQSAATLSFSFKTTCMWLSSTAYPATSRAKMPASSCNRFSIHCLRCSHPSPHSLPRTAEHVERNGKCSERRALHWNQPMIHEASSLIHPYKTRLRATQNHNSTSKLQMTMHALVLSQPDSVN